MKRKEKNDIIGKKKEGDNMSIPMLSDFQITEKTENIYRKRWRLTFFLKEKSEACCMEVYLEKSDEPFWHYSAVLVRNKENFGAWQVRETLNKLWEDRLFHQCVRYIKTQDPDRLKLLNCAGAPLSYKNRHFTPEKAYL